MPARLVIAVGPPGSGKTHFLNQMKSEGGLDVVLEDHLNDWKKWGKTIPPIKRRLAEGELVGTCAQAFLQSGLRDLLGTLIGPRDIEEIEWIYFEPDCPACLRNIVRDALREPARGYPWERMCRVVKIAEDGDIQIPDGVDLIPVFQQEITEAELTTFFRKVPNLKLYNGHARVRSILKM